MTGHVTKPATKFEDLTIIRSWVTSYSGSRWLPLKMCTRPLRMRRIMWPVSRGSKTITFFGIPDPYLPIHYTNFYCAPTTIKGRLISSRPMLKPFSGVKNSKSGRIGPPKWRFFLGGNGGLNLRYWFRNPKKALPCAKPRRLTYFVSKSVHASRR